jgi:hypothetical protein
VRDNIPTPARAANPVASIDTIEIFMPRPPAALRRNIEASTGRRAHVEDCFDKAGKFRGTRAIFNRPTLPALAVIRKIMRAAKWSTISRADIAVDYHTESEDRAGALIDWLDHLLILKWRSAQSQKTRIGDTVYWTDERRARNLVVYRNRKSDRVVRLELRFMNSGAVRRAGLDKTEKLRTASPIKIIAHNVKAQKPTARFTQKAIRTTYQDELKASRSQKSRNHPVTDAYRASIPNRVISILSRADAQSMKNGPGMEGINMAGFIPDQITWPALLNDKGNSE